MRFEVKIDNIKNYTKHLIKCRNEMDNIFKKHTQLGAMKLYEYLTNNTPVDTENLKANWNIAQNVLRDDNGNIKL